MRRLLALLVLSWPVLGLAGTSDRLDKLERQMESVSELLLDVEQLKRENSDLRGQIELLKYELEQLKTQQRELYLDMDRRLSGGKQTSAEPASAPTPPPAPEPTPAAEPPAPSTVTASQPPTGDPETKAYQDAYTLLIPQRRYSDAVAAFQAFLSAYPGGKYADNAQFWIGEAHYANRDFPSAMNEFQKLVETYPDSPKVPDALLKVGYIRHAQGDFDKAREVFNGLVQHYPGTAASRLAQQRLDALNSAGR